MVIPPSRESWTQFVRVRPGPSRSAAAVPAILQEWRVHEQKWPLVPHVQHHRRILSRLRLPGLQNGLPQTCSGRRRWRSLRCAMGSLACAVITACGSGCTASRPKVYLPFAHTAASETDARKLNIVNNDVGYEGNQLGEEGQRALARLGMAPGRPPGQKNWLFLRDTSELRMSNRRIGLIA